MYSVPPSQADPLWIGPRQWWRWLVAASLGALAGMLLFLGMTLLLRVVMSDPADYGGLAVIFALSGMLLGGGLGGVQWALCRRWVRLSGWWAPASAVGGAVGTSVELLRQYNDLGASWSIRTQNLFTLAVLVLGIGLGQFVAQGYGRRGALLIAAGLLPLPLLLLGFTLLVSQ
jgi:hypothetical protein